jgi:hypothetical protein
MIKIGLPKSKLDLAEYLLVGAIVVIAGFTGWYVLASNHNASTAYDNAGQTSPVAKSNKKPSSKSSTSNSSISPTSNQPKPTSGQPSTLFSITRVYFAEAPKVPAGAGFGQCTIGQVINYTSTAQVTAAAAGAMTYHWEVADHLGGTVDKKANQSFTFTGAGAKSFSTDLSYTVRDTGNGSNLFNRQYINLFVTAPNSIYANKENPVYAYKNSTEPFFVWGTYIDLC